MLSIIISTYNGQKYIEKAIKSVLGQSFSDWELIIVNDGSIDNTEKIIKQYANQDNRIKYLKNEKNLGIVKSLNRAIGLAKGKYLARLDDDDKWIDENKIKRQIEFLENNPDYILIGTCGIIIDKYSNKIADYNVPENDSIIRKNILFKNPFINSSTVIRKNILEKVRLYPLGDHGYAEDYRLWLKIGTLGKMFNLRDRMTAYMFRDDSTGLINKKNILKNNISLIYQYRKKYPNYFKALIFAIFKLIIYISINLIFKQRTNKKIINFLFKKYRNLQL